MKERGGGSLERAQPSEMPGEGSGDEGYKETGRCQVLTTWVEHLQAAPEAKYP